ncbi:MAG: hypothetical protein Q8O04_11040 [Deltaproteobacteria bacterium]|nr:hypothetical protein [Deltaproteobacteria bacterium]
MNAGYQDIDGFIFTAEIAEVGVGVRLGGPNKGAASSAPTLCVTGFSAHISPPQADVPTNFK